MATVEEIKKIIDRDRAWRDTAPGYAECSVKIETPNTCVCGEVDCKDAYAHTTSGF